MKSLKEDHQELIKMNKLILKTQQRFRSEKHIGFKEQINKITLSLNDDRRIQSIDLIQTYVYETSKDLVYRKEKIKCNNVIKQYKKFNFDHTTKENIKEHNPNWQ